MDNTERYNEEIIECRDYLTALTITMNKLLEMNNVGSKKGKITKQKKLFEALRTKTKDHKKFIKQFNNYRKKTAINLQKVNDYFFNWAKISEFLYDRNTFSKETIEKIMENFYDNNKLVPIIDNLAQEYKNTIQRIRFLEQSIEDEKLNSQNREEERGQKIERSNKLESTQEELEAQRKLEELEQYNRNIQKSSETLLNGPRSARISDLISGRDPNKNAVSYLYGLTADIIWLMSIDQHINVNKSKKGTETRIWNAEFFADVPQAATNYLFTKYQVSSIEGLLNKYEQIRKKFHKKYSKLSNEKKAKYSIENFESWDIDSSLVSINNTWSSELFDAMKNEKFEFPPNREKIINMINLRIMNGKNYEIVVPSKETKEEPEDYKKYLETKEYYKNLTKNMTIEEVSILYKHVVTDVDERFKYSIEPVDRKSYFNIMQKLFCEVIFDKKGMEVLDSKQRDAALEEIANTILKENLEFSIYGYKNVTEEEQQKREYTMQEEYIKYRAKMNSQGKKDYLSYSEFSKQKYNITNVVEPENMEKMIREEIKGMKR